MMKYTVNIIDTEEKFREKFGADPQWIISTPQGEGKALEWAKEKKLKSNTDVRGKAIKRIPKTNS